MDSLLLSMDLKLGSDRIISTRTYVSPGALLFYYLRSLISGLSVDKLHCRFMVFLIICSLGPLGDLPLFHDCHDHKYVGVINNLSDRKES